MIPKQKAKGGTKSNYTRSVILGRTRKSRKHTVGDSTEGQEETETIMTVMRLRETVGENS